MSARAAQRVKEIVDQLADIRLSDLSNTAKSKATLQELDSCLNEVRGFAQAVESVIAAGFPADRPRRGRPAKVVAKPVTRFVAKPRAAAPMARRPGRRGPGEFSATPFILSCVQSSGKSGIRPREIVEQVQQAAPGQHVRPSALVSTILTRLKKRGEVSRRSGKWFPKS